MHSSTSPIATAPATTRLPARRLSGLRLVLALYSVALATIAFWPAPVDRGAEGLLEGISDNSRWLSYVVIEATANVLLFVPLGILLALVLSRKRWLVIAIALVVTVAIELGQALFLAERTPSLADVIANVVGAAIGLVFVLAVESRTRRRG